MASENNQIEITSPLSRNRQDLSLSDIRDLVAKYKCVRTACQHFVRTLSDSERQRLTALVKETKFSRRKYGGRYFYCWAHHAVFRASPIDPWPAAHYPRAVLMAEFAIRT